MLICPNRFQSTSEAVFQMLKYFLCFSSSATRPSYSPTAWPRCLHSLVWASLTLTMARRVRVVTSVTSLTTAVIITPITRASLWWGSALLCSHCCCPVTSTQLTSGAIMETRVHCPSSLSSPAMTSQEVIVQIRLKCINQVHIKLYKHFLLWYHSWCSIQLATRSTLIRHWNKSEFIFAVIKGNKFSMLKLFACAKTGRTQQLSCRISQKISIEAPYQANWGQYVELFIFSDFKFDYHAEFISQPISCSYADIVISPLSEVSSVSASDSAYSSACRRPPWPRPSCPPSRPWPLSALRRPHPTLPLQSLFHWNCQASTVRKDLQIVSDFADN